ncbi:MAG: glycosyltransferase family 2 protein [Lachnospiraceae bacterium]|nr:glycosyltransferase family 2 protein [Lachnospiraceae bacterium]
MEEKVSIIVPVYNAQNYIKETIESVQKQDYTNWELILVENGSTDDSLNCIQTIRDERIRVICAGDNIGAARARNLGMQEATGEYVCYLDADDLWDEDKLSSQIAFMKEKQAAFSFTGYEFADAAGQRLGKIVKVPDTITYYQALGNTTIFTSTVMFDTRRIVRERLNMPVIESEDTALWFKLLREGETAYGLNRNLVRYRRPDNSLSSNKLVAMKRIWNLYRKAEHLNVFVSAWYFVQWAVRAVLRRV